MLKLLSLAALVATVAVSAAVVGCAKKDESAPKQPATQPAAPGDATTPPAADSSAAPGGVPASFASLSQADQTAALAQKTCPVSDEPLGSMGTPIKITISGRDVFICCDACKDPLEKDPRKYLAKLAVAK